MNTEQLHWFKSSHSDGEGGNCIEIAYEWRKSSYSSGEGGECVEVATCPAAVHVRDSKNVQGPQLDVAPGAWTAFVSYAQQG
ncbi:MULTISPECIES: DUF397 domain-containing protein [unclassified Streptomyces]|uniref:DUF397 domain-containing protein n=1 Tax=unclassified Streptomyces TaxID=2593676 RepID=UPI002DDB83C1|nr:MULTISPECIES: DUF397 domain-containing protein [unclassified Streptomyces]WSC29593.1 DUF397 domain-containing protein [Streptomyces sp. NBC_01768]WSP48428.1 DUF397 domain-containing protein [Streptomyces sp. NBC_01243]WSX02088.1 DUF397 domain-containing protein [Streptomyces sp. NBC_00987]